MAANVAAAQTTIAEYFSGKTVSGEAGAGVSAGSVCVSAPQAARAQSIRTASRTQIVFYARFTLTAIEETVTYL